MSQYTLEDLVTEKHKIESAIQAGKRLETLLKNADFKEIILDGFCKTESARYAHESGDHRLSESQRASALAMAQAGGRLEEWLHIRINLNRQLESQKEAIEEAIVKTTEVPSLEGSEVD